MDLGYFFIKIKQLVYKNKQVKQSFICGLNLRSVVDLGSRCFSFWFLKSLTCHFSSAFCPRSPRYWGNPKSNAAPLLELHLWQSSKSFCLFLMRLYYKDQFQIVVINANYVIPCLFAICKNCLKSLEKHYYICFKQLFSNEIIYGF